MKKFRPKYNEYIAFLKTDILPFELSISFSNDKLYEWIIDNKYYYKEQKKLNDSTPSSPYSFDSYVRADKYRKISLINPYSYLDVLKYIEKYERIYISQFKESPYSIRYPQKMMDNYQYSQKIRSKHYSSEKIDKLEKKNGSYYKITPYKRSYEFENSNFFQKRMQEYSTFAKVDIKSCFDSIYTHSYKWITAPTYKQSKILDDKNIYKATDLLNQRINGHKSNGILIGPEFMRLQAEMLLGQIDKKIANQLEEQKIYDKKIYRFIDDYYIFSTSKEEVNSIVKVISNELDNFQLHLNESKTKVYDDYFDLNDWYNDINYAMEIFDLTKFYTPKIRKVLYELYIKHKNKRSTIMSFILSVCTNNYFNLIVEFYNIEKLSIDKISEEVKKDYGILEDNGEYNKSELLINYIEKNLSENKIFKVLDELIYYVSLEPKYINSLKLIHLIIELLILENHLINYTNKISYKNVIKNVITKNRKILLSCKTNDNINILIIFEYLDIKLTSDEVSEFIEVGNLITLAQLNRYAKNTERTYEKLDTIIQEKKVNFKNKLIEEEHLKELFDSEEIWFFILFPEYIIHDENIKPLIEVNDNLITKFLIENNEFFDTKPIENIDDLRILNERLYFKSLVNINY